jgi:hypothetical protein
MLLDQLWSAESKNRTLDGQVLWNQWLSWKVAMLAWLYIEAVGGFLKTRDRHSAVCSLLFGVRLVCIGKVQMIAVWGGVMIIKVILYSLKKIWKMQKRNYILLYNCWLTFEHNLFPLFLMLV